MRKTLKGLNRLHEGFFTNIPVEQTESYKSGNSDVERVQYDL